MAEFDFDAAKQVIENSIGEAKSFLDAGCVGLGIGGNLVSKKLISEGKYDELTALARTYVNAIS